MHPLTLLIVPLTTCIAIAFRPNVSLDPAHCLTENLTPYLDPPKPTGSLFDAIESHAASLVDPCVVDGTTRSVWPWACPFPAQSRWCAFSTAAPTDVLPAYSSFANQAYSWWEERSSAVVSLRENCPNVWENALLHGSTGREEWLNDTIAFAGCYAEALTTAGSATTGTTSGGSRPTELTATSRSGVTVGKIGRAHV